MFKGSHSSAVYGLSYKARCIAAQLGDQENTRFFVGTLSLKEENQLHHIEVIKDVTETVCINIYDHPHEIWDISSSPFQQDLLFTIFHEPKAYKAMLWSMDETNAKLIPKAELPGHKGKIKRVLWEPSEDGLVVSLDNTTLRTWDITKPEEPLAAIELGTTHAVSNACFNPLVTDLLAVTVDTSICGYDVRQKKEAFIIKDTHKVLVRDVDINPLRQYYMVTGGDDCKIRFWDYRKPDKCLKEFEHHNHWVCNVKYNRFRDELVLSCATDSTVNLYRVESLSFKNLQDSDDEDEGEEETPKPAPKDELIKPYDDHEDSVYSIAWASEANNWAFASLSYDGRVVVNSVSQDIQDELL